MVANTDSILDSTKKALGLGPEYDVFDPDIIMHINSVFVTLQQLGIGPDEGFAIEDADATWNTFLETRQLLNPARQYVFFKVRIAFDPPPTSFHMASLEKQIQELEWRMSVTRDELIGSAMVTVPPEFGGGTDPLIVEGGGAEDI